MNRQNTIWCVGRNYLEHAQELGNALPEQPLVFTKPWASIQVGKEVVLWSEVTEANYELEVVVRVTADRQVSHLGLGLDLTDRKAQQHAKINGLPWTLAKGFKGATVLSDFIRVSEFSIDFEDLNFSLKRNGKIVQQANTKMMMFSVGQIITYLFDHFPVTDGDLIFTGTPSGVGPITREDLFSAKLDGLLEAEWRFSQSREVPSFQETLF